jgi:phenylalanyl-tRNA synthetase beta chain
MHAFDLDKLEGGKIVVRFAKAGEKIKALDEKEYKLSPDILVIADAKNPQAIAGVMGGLASAVGLKTTKIFLESAHFAPPAIRKATANLRLRSDSSFRFERGTDLGAVEIASNRATELILSVCGKQAQAAAARDEGQRVPERVTITTSIARLNHILGSDFPEVQAAGTLKRIAETCGNDGGKISFVPPSWRADLQTPWDLAEELARMFGYQNIPAKASPVVMRPSRITPSQSLAGTVRARLAGFGLCEAYNYDFISEKSLERCGLTGDFAKLANPISEDWTVLRPSLLPGLLHNASSNLNHGAERVRLFEIGKVFTKNAEGVEERAQLAGVLLGPVTEAFWQPARVWRSGAYDALGVVEGLLAGVPGITFAAGTGVQPLLRPHGWRSVESAKGPLGFVGALSPKAARAWDLEREDASVFMLDLERLLELSATGRRFSPFSQFPSVKRDLSVLIDAKTHYAELLKALPAAKELTPRVELIDLFTGKSVPAGKKSLTLRFTFSRLDRTLRDDEVNAAMDAILGALKEKLGAALRS